MSKQPEATSDFFRRHYVTAILVVVVGLVALVWSGGVVYSFVSLHISRAYPEWAWQHGTPEMQYVASTILVHRIHPGMTFEQVLAVLGPGSADWPAVRERAPRREDDDIPQVVSFNLRDSGSIGIDVYFLHSRVTRASPYD